MGQRNPSAITTALAVDEPLIQDADFEMDADDRQYLDNQIRGVQQHLVDTLIRGRHATYVRVAASSAQVPAGFAACLASLDEAEPQVELALSAALSEAVAAFGVTVNTAAPGSFALIAFGGVLPPTLTGLPKNAPGFVRVSTSTGALERVASLSSGDYGIGVVDKAGYMLVVPGISVGATGGSAPGLPARSIQCESGGLFAGAALSWISLDGAIELRTSAIRPVPATGQIRTSRTFAFKTKNADETLDLSSLSSLTYAGTKSLLMLASDGTTGNAAFHGLDISVKEAIDVKVGTISGGVYPVGAHYVGPGSLSGGGATAKYVQFFPNMALALDGTIGGTSDVFNGALGLYYQRAMNTLPSAAPASGYYDRANPTSFRPECIIPGDNPTTGWRQYLAESIVGQSLKIPQVKSDESGYQFVSPIVLPSAAVSSILTLGTSGTITALDPTGRTVGDVPQVVDIGGGVLRVQWGAQAGSGFTAGGDLSGTSTSQTVSKIQGVAISGTPANGYFLRATGSSAATWQSVTIPTSAGGSGQLNVADGSGGWQTAPNVTASTDNVSIGGTPATSGVGLRIPKVGGVYFRNSANSGNLPLITVDGFDQPNIGSTTAGGNTFVLSQTGIYFQLGAGPATPLAISPTFVQFGKPVSGYASSNTPFSFKDALIDLTGLTTKTLSAAEYVCPRLYVTRGTGTTCEIVLPNSFNGAVWVVTVDNAIAGLEVKFTHTTGGAGATVSTGQTRLLVFDTLQSKYVLANP